MKRNTIIFAILNLIFIAETTLASQTQATDQLHASSHSLQMKNPNNDLIKYLTHLIKIENTLLARTEEMELVSDWDLAKKYAGKLVAFQLQHDNYRSYRKSNQTDLDPIELGFVMPEQEIGPSYPPNYGYNLHHLGYTHDGSRSAWMSSMSCALNPTQNIKMRLVTQDELAQISTWFTSNYPNFNLSADQ